MASVSVLFFFLLCHLLHPHSTEPKPDKRLLNCPHSFHCGKLGNLSFPFTDHSNPYCGFFIVSDCNEPEQIIQLQHGRRFYKVDNISQPNTIMINDADLHQNLYNRSCEYFNRLDFLSLGQYMSFHYAHNVTMLKCPSTTPVPSSQDFWSANCSSTYDYNVYYSHQNNGRSSLGPPQGCLVIQLPANLEPPRGDESGNLFSLLSARFLLQVQIHKKCIECYNKGGECLGDTNRSFHCLLPKENDKLGLKLGLGLGFGCSSIVAICLLFYIIRRRYKLKYASSEYITRNNSYDPSSTADLEGGGSVFFGLGVPIFSYTELEEATNNFNESNELGDGGFGAVYYGKLRDGREVAVKRLYQHNYRRLEQFINEIEILTRLRHKNLVSLYGCTSRRSRELLLVYEFIPNGTLAHHLHGEGSNTGSLTWPIRMSIALETASALAYLHASDTIHRDVKTDNILLDSNFSVKVADFGLSRLFPNDVTHVSTAPQGTPGYVDPEYHQCYQLTDKSDVYSFGVVLIELVSSMPAVDISRHRHDINLANFAMNRIQRRAFGELVDPSLGFDSDENVRIMIMQVAELAFRCLQQDKEMRPDMKEVVENLKVIEKGGKFEVMEESESDGDDDHDGEVVKMVKPPPSPDCCDEIGLLKNEQALPEPTTGCDEVRLVVLKDVMRAPNSPVSVTDRWISNTTTPNTSS